MLIYEVCLIRILKNDNIKKLKKCIMFMKWELRFIFDGLVVVVFEGFWSGLGLYVFWWIFSLFGVKVWL